jgi:Tripartite tricarboxylate transporter family receptor
MTAMPKAVRQEIRAIAVTTATRWSGAPDIPTIAESGVPGYEVSGWFGLLAPPRTAKRVIGILGLAGRYPGSPLPYLSGKALRRQRRKATRGPAVRPYFRMPICVAIGRYFLSSSCWNCQKASGPL